MARRILKLALFLLLSLACAELMLRAGSLVAPRLLTRSEPAPADDAFVILCLGDSNTYGAGVARDQTYPARLERLLNGAGAGRRFEVLNLGVPGINSSQLLLRLPRFIDHYAPDLLIVLIGANDKWNVAESRAVGARSFASRVHAAALQHSFLYRLLGWRLRMSDQGRALSEPNLETLSVMRLAGGDSDETVRQMHLGDGDEVVHYRSAPRDASLEPEEHRRLVRSNLERIAALARSRRVPLVFTSYVSDVRAYGPANEELIAFDAAPTFRLKVPDLTARAPELAQLPYEALYTRTHHPREPLYAAFAGGLCDALAREGLVPVERCPEHEPGG